MTMYEELLTRGIANCIPNKEKLLSLLAAGKKLHVYLGIDPTATRIHLGHAVALRKLQAFAQLGHTVTFLIGDFTAQIGDTSDKESERPQLTAEEIASYVTTYKSQAEKIVDFAAVSVRYNSEWLQHLTFQDIIKLCQHFSFGDFASRELIRKRLEKSTHVGLHEALYPVMQGYDAYMLDCDIQIGGTDQTFNMQAGRQLQQKLRQKETYILTTEFLMGTDGRKMSKSWGNAIWLTDTPEDMYGKIMAIPDEQIIPYYTLATMVALNEITTIKSRLEKGENPRDIKKELAKTIVTELVDLSSAMKAEEAFTKTIQHKQVPTDMPLIRLAHDPMEIAHLLVQHNLVPSKAEAKRLISQHGVRINDEEITESTHRITPSEGMIINIGKRGYYKVTLV